VHIVADFAIFLEKPPYVCAHYPINLLFLYKSVINNTQFSQKKSLFMIGKLKKSQLFWNIASFIANYYPIRNFNKIPREIAIELTNHCNLRCPVCPTHFAMERERGFMDLNMYKSIIDEFRDYKFKPKILYIFAGEPLLHPQADEFIAYACQNGHDTFLSTNVTALTEELSKKIIGSGLKSIHLCIDGASKESHESYRVGSDFEIVKKNIENFLKIKYDLKSNWPNVTIQTLLTSYSEKEIDQITQWAKKMKVDNIQFKSISLGSFTTPEMKQKYQYLLPNNKAYLRKTSKIIKTVCTVPLTQTLIYWNGDMGLCCVDVNNDIKLLNIKEKGLINNYKCIDIKIKRKMGMNKKFFLCKKCSLSQSDSMGYGIKINNINA